MENQDQPIEEPKVKNVPQSKPNKRFYVIQELISTEMTYVERLKITLDFVITPLKNMKIVSAEDISNQFDFLEDIYKLHSRNPIDGTSSQNLKFIDLFDDISKNLQIYSNYLVNYEPAMQRRGHLLISNRRFSDFIEKTEKDPLLQSQTIESLLILPVQRIPRYRLLLDQLLKFTPEDHPDFPIVQQSLDKICDLAMYNNEAIRDRENKNKMMSIMMQMEPTSRVDLLAKKNRKFIKEGLLLRQCRRRYKEFQFWLFSDELLYGEKTALGAYALHRQIPLQGCQVVPLAEDDTDVFNGFIIASSSKSFKVKAKGDNEKVEWIEILTETINAYRKEYSEQSDENNDEINAIAPLWTPDTDSSNCKVCGSTFTLLFLRRHHCRNCGKLVCDNCSSNRYCLPHVDKTKNVRICDPCHSMLVPNDDENFPYVHAANDNNRNNNERTDIDDGKLREEDDESDDESDVDDDDDLLRIQKGIRGTRQSLGENDLNEFNEYMEGNEEKVYHAMRTTSKETKFHIIPLSPTLEAELTRDQSNTNNDSNPDNHPNCPAPPPKPPKPIRRTILTSQPSTSSSTSPISSHTINKNIHETNNNHNHNNTNNNNNSSEKTTRFQRPTLLPRISLADLASVALRPIGHLLPTKDVLSNMTGVSPSMNSNKKKNINPVNDTTSGIINTNNPIGQRAPRRTNVYMRTPLVDVALIPPEVKAADNL